MTVLRGPADAWTECARGHRHWGAYGAAGLLVHATTPAGVHVLLQHRSPWSHAGDTWGVPGGARQLSEDTRTAALREAAEETDIDLGRLTLGASYTDDHGGWAYVTVLAELIGEGPLPVVSPRSWESLATAWVPVPGVSALPLHPGFAESWTELRRRLDPG